MDIENKEPFHNVSFEDKKPFKVPFKMVISGFDSSRKPHVVINLISLMNMTFNKVYFYTRNKDEPLYEYLEMVKPDKDLLEVHEGIDHLKSIDLDNHYFGQTLIVFDGLENERDQNKIVELYCRGRILGCSLVYLASKFSSVSPTIRENANYLIFKKIASERELYRILRDVYLEVNKEEFLKMHQFCTEGGNPGFLMIDLCAKKEHKFRHNFMQVLNINFFK